MTDRPKRKAPDVLRSPWQATGWNCATQRVINYDLKVPGAATMSVMRVDPRSPWWWQNNDEPNVRFDQATGRYHPTRTGPYALAEDAARDAEAALLKLMRAGVRQLRAMEAGRG